MYKVMSIPWLDSAIGQVPTKEQSEAQKVVAEVSCACVHWYFIAVCCHLLVQVRRDFAIRLRWVEVMRTDAIGWHCVFECRGCRIWIVSSRHGAQRVQAGSSKTWRLWDGFTYGAGRVEWSRSTGDDMGSLIVLDRARPLAFERNGKAEILVQQGKDSK